MVRVGVGQFAAGTDKPDNLATIERLLARGAEQGAELMVFPEFAMYYEGALTEATVAAAEPLDGPFATTIGRLAKQHEIVVVAGMLETVPGEDRVYNTVLAVDGAGQPLGVYRKLHLYDAFGFRESDRIRPGDPDAPVTFDVGGVTFGAMTCYDVRFPELARVLVDAGAQALLLPAAWVAGPQKETHWTTLARARAIENTVYVVAVDQAPSPSAGCSLIADPMGVPVASLGEETGVAVAELSAERIERVRAKNPSLAHRRFRVVPV